MNRWCALVAATFLSLMSATSAVAHFGADSFIFVPDEDILPGGQFTVIGSDLAPDSQVSFELRNDSYATGLGRATAGPDGHFETALTMPADARLGYIELIASSPDGTSASTWILVGPRTPETGPSPAAAGSAGPLDPSLLVLGVLLGGTIAAVGYAFLRRRGPGDAGASGTVTAETTPRTRIARKSRRRDHGR